MTQARFRARNERGVALPLAGIGILAVLGFGLVTLEIGQLGVVSSELQNAADASALAGALAIARDRDVDVDVQDVAVRNLLTSRSGGKGISASNVASINVGQYIDGAFVANVLPPNAVEVVLTDSVENLAYVSGSQPPNTDIAARSVAILTGCRNCSVDLPLAIGCCQMGPAVFCCPPEEPIGAQCVPDPNQVITGVGTSANPQTRFTTFDQTETSWANVRSHLVQHPACPVECGAQATEPIASEVGQVLNLRPNTTLIQAGTASCIESCYLVADADEVMLPIVPCEPGSQQPILGYGRFKIEAVSPSGIAIRPVAGAIVPGPGGGGAYGVFSVSLAE